MSEEERAQALLLIDILEDPVAGNKDTYLMRLGKLISRADMYNPLPSESNILACQHEVYLNVWREAAELRRQGKLLAMGKKIRCPVVAVHGDFDPHPAEGVRRPLGRILEEFRFILLEKCGHTPWIERHARDVFYRVLKKEIGKTTS
jgi:pimeloyl-ACP methyl ester carboxylesterase